jgi:hypothetical protein
MRFKTAANDAQYRQNSCGRADFRNLGVVARALVAVNLLGLARWRAKPTDARARCLRAQHRADRTAAAMTLAALTLRPPLLRRLPYWLASILDRARAA